MTAAEYEEALQIAARIRDAARTAADSEYQRKLEALAIVWAIYHDGPPPSTAFAKVSVVSNGATASQTARIQRIIKGWDHAWPIDTRIIMRRYGEMYPDDENQPESSTVSKVFRKMEKKKELRCVAVAGFQRPAQYDKIREGESATG